MAPPAARVHRCRLGQQPQLRQQRVHAVPAVHAQNRQPELGPRRGLQWPAVQPQKRARAPQPRLVATRAQKPGRDVVQTAAEKRGALALHVQPPAAVAVLMQAHVAQALRRRRAAERLAGDVEADDHVGQLEHGPGVVAGPESLERLQAAVVARTGESGGEGGVLEGELGGWGKRG